jgi:hypothetical protein
MSPSSEVDEIRGHLQRLGIAVPDSDLPFLQRTRARQIALAQTLAQTVAPTVTPAMVFHAVPAHPRQEGAAP